MASAQQAQMEAAVQEVAGHQMLKIAEQVKGHELEQGCIVLVLTAALLQLQEERKLDEAIQKLDAMGEDDFEVLRQRRLEKMKKQQRQKQEWMANGHGA
jgi:hypothetical protein